MIMQGDAQDLYETTRVEGIKSAPLVRVQGPCFAAVEQCAEHASLTDLHFGFDGQHGVVPDPSDQKGHYRCCLVDPWVQLSV